MDVLVMTVTSPEVIRDDGTVVMAEGSRSGSCSDVERGDRVCVNKEKDTNKVED
ncbi:hypothetical protein HanPI659440_Chr05g0195901 [Helianthus annuus]|nr:hypothetical protein HanPI659440_Chr05g0195901 [Helianthus annuus]